MSPGTRGGTARGPTRGGHVPRRGTARPSGGAVLAIVAGRPRLPAAETSKAQQLISSQFLTRIYEEDGTPTGTELSTTRPRQVVVIGSLREFTHNGAVKPEKMSSFELYRTSIQDVEVITFDELYERAASSSGITGAGRCQGARRHCRYP